MSQKARSSTQVFADAVAKWQAADVPSQGERFAQLKPLWDVVTGVPLADRDYHRLMAEMLTCCNAAITDSTLVGETSRLEPCRPWDVFAKNALEALAAADDLTSGTDLPSNAAVGPDQTCLEDYLREHAPRRRAELGVFFTPESLARYTVRQVHNTLREKFGLTDGLADTATWAELSQCHGIQLPSGVDPASAFVSILEPSVGSGVFLVAAIELIYETLGQKWADEGHSEHEATRRWNRYVTELLPRLTAFDLLPAACASAQLQIVRRLLDSGYRFQSADRLSCFVVNTLIDPADLLAELLFFNEQTQAELARLHRALAKTTYTVILGNPPFRGVSDNTARWMQRLLRGEGPDGSEVASYYDIDGKPLGERKLWLQDDYVKFLRYAQWHIERAGAGVVGFVTNHGYLDNTTFRGVRNAMQQTFDGIDILDLHGNRKKGERNPDGGVDESVFDIDQGVAVGVFSRSWRRESPVVVYREAWGSREAKLTQLETPDGCQATRLSPAAPHFLFVPRGSHAHAEYAAGLPINEVMPVNSTAVVTARDSFVVAFTKDELLARMRVFRDRDVGDDEIRARYFTRGRSNKYPPGDTRGWKLADARRRMMQDPNWDKHIQPCDYRPFDRRVIYWADWMVDWPRADVMCHMTQRENMALVTRRQTPTLAACDYFWLTNSIAVDGLVRSDNRGSESLFPLFVDGDVNLSAEFLEAVEDAIGLKWTLTASRSPASFDPYSAFFYIYALFNSTVYRARYAAELRQEFPRILLPKNAGLWHRLAGLGKQIAGEVLRHNGTPDCGPRPEKQVRSSDVPVAEESPPADEVVLARDYPKYEDRAIWLANGGPSFPASPAVWEYQVGTYQVCRKWARDRKRLSGLHIAAYEQMLGAISRMLSLTASIDDAIARAGGPEYAFLA